jgi:hypothetical protein
MCETAFPENAVAPLRGEKPVKYDTISRKSKKESERV